MDDECEQSWPGAPPGDEPRHQPHSQPYPYPYPYPALSFGPDPDWDSYVAWLDGEIAEGRDPAEGQAPDEFSEAGACVPRFGQGDEADVLPPGPLLVALTEEAVRDFGALSDNELAGVIQAARRQRIREEYKQVLAVAEFARRREAAFEDAKRHGVPAGCRPGGFPGEELAIELAVTRAEAAALIEDSADLTARLPATLAGMAAGLIDDARAHYIAVYTRGLTPADAARADQALAAAAPDLRVDQLARKAAALEMKLAPEAVKARKEHARNTAQRVEARREFSGNACLSAREMGTADAMASQAYLKAIAVRLRNGGLDAPIGALCVQAMADLTQGRNPLDRLRHATAPTPAPPGTPADGTPADGTPGSGYAGPGGWPGWDDDDAENARYHDPLADDLDETARRGPVRPGAPVPLPALINLLVPASTVLGWSAAPARAGTWGLLDRDETRAVIQAAGCHPRTRWCVTLTSGNGEAIAHACARGQHPGLLDDLGPQPPPARLAGLLRRLGITPGAIPPIASGTCDHAHAEDHYAPSRKLKHLIRARTATCDAPGCAAQAVYADLDHTVPYPGGPTDECNLGPRCRTHHRAKQAPDWKVEQPEPGVIRWTLPSGRTHVTTPTSYEI